MIFAGALGSCPLPLARPSWPQGSQTHRPTLTPSVVGVGEVAGGFVEEGGVGADVLEGMKGWL